MGNIGLGIFLWMMTLLIYLTPLFHLTIVQLFILLAIWVYIPQLFYTIFDDDIWNLTSVAGISVLFSFQLDQGFLSMLLVVPWIGISISIFYNNLPQFDLNPNSILHISSISFMIAAPLALGLSRMGLQPLDFSHEIIELTAIHFHYAGIMIPAFVGQVYIRIPSSMMRYLSYLIAIGTPVVALGITVGQFFPPIGLIAVFLFSGPLIIISGNVILSELRLSLTIAHVMLILAMILSIYYAIGTSFAVTTISIAAMITTHGLINGGVFVPLSLYGWYTEMSGSS